MAPATELPSGYNGNMPGSTHGGPDDQSPTELKDGESSQCIWPEPDKVIDGWLSNGNRSGYRFDQLDWNGTCHDGQVRVQRLPTVRVNIDGTLNETYFGRGGSGSAPFGPGYSTAERDSAIRHAHVRIGDLETRPTAYAGGIDHPSIAPNGKACPNTTVLYRTVPRNIPGYYKSLATVNAADPANTTNRTTDWANYGDARFAVPGGKDGGRSYNYLLWNWKWGNNTGGGQVRASLEAGTAVRRCDVSAISSNMYELADEDPNTAADTRDAIVGTVRGIYGYFRDGANEPHYGWVVHSYKLNSDTGWTYLLCSDPNCPGGSSAKIQAAASIQRCYVKEGDFGAGWAEMVSPNCAQIELAGGHMTTRTTTGACAGKYGLWDGWGTILDPGCADVATSPNRWGFLTTTGQCTAKAHMFGSFVEQWYPGCAEIDVTDGRVAVRTTGGQCFAKEGGLTGSWVGQLDSGCAAISIDGDRIAIRTTAAQCIIKEGPLTANWGEIISASDCYQVELGGGHIVVRTSTGDCATKNGPWTSWTTMLSQNCRDIATSGNRWAFVRDDDECVAKEGSTGAPWASMWGPGCAQVSVTDGRVAVLTE